MDGKGSLQTQDLPGCCELTGMKTNARSDSPLCYQLVSKTWANLQALERKWEKLQTG